jgi:tricorn protease interacting factor F2/3
MEVRNYQLELNFDLEKKIYEGKEKIFLNLDKEDLIKIDSVDLKIKELKINDKEVDFDVIQDKILIKNGFQKGENTIFINFEGELKEVLGGIYLSKYKDKEEEKYLITTQFEPVEARKAFPCFDDPDKKATFDLTLIFPKDLKAISNTLPVKEEILGEKKKVIFETSPKMSTYLLYIGIGDFYFLEDKYKDVLIRVAFTPKEKLEGAKFALENCKKFLSYLEEYFNVPYPLKKLDLIAIPDFAAGAMENWGAITFRENYLLVFEGITPQTAKERVCEVIAHELVHMWFGNLVTMKWWDDLWLNESFATYLAYKAVNHFYPEWRILDKYIVDEVFSALNADALISSHPIKVEVKDPQESTEIFDEISYEKGGSVLRMIENYLGEEKFRDGLRNYIKKFSYQNAQAEDLWNSLEEASQVNVKEIMKDYLEKTGFPQVEIKKEDGNYLLKQKRFLFLEKTQTDADLTQTDADQNNLYPRRSASSPRESAVWKIPMVIKSKDREIRIIFDKESTVLSDLEPPIILNKNYSSFFVSNYDDEIWRNDLENLNKRTCLPARQGLTQTSRGLTPKEEIDYIHLLHDYEFFVRKGEKSLDDFCKILENYFLNLEGKFLLSEVISYLNFYYYFTSPQINADFNTDKRGYNFKTQINADITQINTDNNNQRSSALNQRLSALLEKFSLKVLEILSKEPKEKELPYETALRNKAIYSLGLIQNEEILNWSKEKFEEFLKNKESLHPDIKQAIFNNAVLIDEKYSESLLNYFQETNLIEEQNKCLVALGNLQNLDKLKNIFDFVLEKVRFNQVIFFLSSLASNLKAKKFSFELLKNNWSRLEERGGGPGKSDFVLIRILKTTIPYLGAFVSEEELESFLNQENFQRFEKTRKVILEKAKVNRLVLIRSQK